MEFNRRRWLELAAGTGAVSCFSGMRSTAPVRPELAELDRAADAPVLNRELFNSPVVIESIDVLRGDRDHFVRVRSKDGAEGVSLTNSRPYLHPILNQLVGPYFIGKDARDLETHLWKCIDTVATTSYRAWRCGARGVGGVCHPGHAGKNR